MTSSFFHNKHPVLAFSLLSLILTILFFHRAFFFGEGYSGASNLFNDSLYRLSMPKGWRFITVRDYAIYWQMLPWDLYAARSLRNGEIPLWNPYSGAGSPFIANWQTTVFSPLKLPLYIYPSVRMFDLLLIFKVWLGSFLTFLFCRARKMEFLSAVLAALAYGFGGSMISSLRLFELNTLSLSPLFFLAIHRVSLSPTLRTAAWGSLACALLLLSGHPEATAYTFIGGLVYAVFTGEKTRRGRRSGLHVLNKYSCLALLFIGGAMISSVALIPFFEYLSAGFTYRMHVSGETGPLWGALVRLGSLLLPVSLPEFPDAYFLYIGILPLVFSSYSLKNARAHLPLLALLLLGVGFVIILPPLSLLEYLPVLRQFSSRYAIGLVSFPLSVLAGEGMSSWLRTHKETGLRLRTAAGIFFLVLCVIGCALIPLAHVVRPWLSRIEFHLVLGLIFSCTAILVGSVRKSASQYIIIPLLMADLFLAGSRFNAPGPLFDFPDTPSVRFLKNAERPHPPSSAERVLGMEGSNNIPNTGLVHRIQDIRVIDPMFPRRYIGFIQLIDPQAFFQIGAIPRRVVSPLWSLLNVRYVIRCTCRVFKTENEDPGIFYVPYPGPIVWRETPHPPGASFTEVYSDDYVSIYENHLVFPRAFIVPTAFLTRDEASSYMLLKNGGFDPGRKAIIEVGDEKVRETIIKTMMGRQGKFISNAEIVTYEPHRVTIKARLSSPGFLILADAYYPGWKVFIDGREGKIFPADYLLRGVPLSAGDHVVEFSYSPMSFKIGAALSLPPLFICILLVRKVDNNLRSGTKNRSCSASEKEKLCRFIRTRSLTV